MEVCQRDIEPYCKSSQWPKLEQFEQNKVILIVIQKLK